MHQGQSEHETAEESTIKLPSRGEAAKICIFIAVRTCPPAEVALLDDALELVPEPVRHRRVESRQEVAQIFDNDVPKQSPVK